MRADATIDENVAIQRDLDATVANLVRATQDGVERGTAALNQYASISGRDPAA